jgi:hypothetical protein
MTNPPLSKLLAEVGSAYRATLLRIAKAHAAGSDVAAIARAMRAEPAVANELLRQAVPDYVPDGGQPDVAPRGNLGLPPSGPLVEGPAATSPPARSAAGPGERTIPDGCALTDGSTVTAKALAHYSTRHRNVWLPADGARVLHILSTLPEETTRVFLLGPPDALAVPGYDSRAEGVRAWFTQRLPEGWHGAGHYLADGDAPVGRYVYGPTGREVTMYRAAAWFGEDQAATLTASAARRAATWIEKQIEDVRLPGSQRRPAGAQMLATPATTGRDILMRLLPAGAEYPVLSPELRELIKATSGQGRMELLGPTGADDARTLPGLTYLDGRLMYAGLTWGMPDGRTRLWTGEALGRLSADEQTRVIAGRSRWRVSYTVPKDWDHVGLLMTRDDSGGWWYPSEPGATGTTWAGGSEAMLAIQNGWDVRVHEGMSWGECKALDTWTKTMVAMHGKARADVARGELDADLLPACRAAVRNMIVTAIGAMAPRGHAVTRTATDPADVPRGVEVRMVRNTYTWQEDQGLPAWTLRMAHPEWAATVWERARVRLLHGPTGATDAAGGRISAGALHVPRRDVVAFRTDAIYLTHDPRWPSDDKPGRFRSKGSIRTPVPRPYSLSALLSLRDAAEAAGA